MWYLQRHYLVWMFYSFSLGYKGNSWFQAHVPLIIQTDAFPILIDLCIEHELLIQKGFPVFHKCYLQRLQTKLTFFPVKLWTSSKTALVVCMSVSQYCRPLRSHLSYPPALNWVILLIWVCTDPGQRTSWRTNCGLACRRESSDQVLLEERSDLCCCLCLDAPASSLC